jgi:Fur family ferric uptake transcriptional regulator
MDAERVAAILDRLREDGGRITASRRRVVETLVSGGHHHVTAPGLVAAVRAVDPDAQESTVYRTLERLVEIGVLTPIEAPGAATTFHFASAAHHHLVCDSCGRVVGAPSDLLGAVAQRLRAEHGFVLRPDAVTLPGRCLDCTDPTPPDADHPEG